MENRFNLVDALLGVALLGTLVWYVWGDSKIDRYYAEKRRILWLEGIEALNRFEAQYPSWESWG